MLTFEEVLELDESDKIRHYINIGKTAEIESKKTRTYGKRKTKGSTSYEVVLSSGLDVVIEKNTEQFIFMPSQDKYVIKTDAGMKNIKDITFQEFENFFRPFPSDGIEVHSLLIDKIDKGDLLSIFNMIREKSDLLKQGMLSWPIYRSMNTRIINSCVELEPKLWKNIVVKTPILSANSSKYNTSFIYMVYGLYLTFDYDAANYFIETYVKSSMIGINFNVSTYMMINNLENAIRGTLSENSFRNLFMAKDTHYTPNRLIDYLCYDLYTQGYSMIPTVTYQDYINISYAYEGRVRDKYPDALETYHDVINLKYRENRVVIDNMKYRDIYTDFRNAYGKEEKDASDPVFYEKNGIALMIPESPNALIDEGNNLGHCVGSYRTRIVSGECLILFARKKENIGESYLTVELIPVYADGKKTYSIAQIQGDCKRTDLTEEEIDYFKTFAKKYNFEIANRNFK